MSTVVFFSCESGHQGAQDHNDVAEAPPRNSNISNEADDDWVLSAEEVRIVAVDSHPFLADHKRELQIPRADGSIDKVGLFPDFGPGCSAFLFRDDQGFVLIDCNGYWYFLNREEGGVRDYEWRWNADLPDEYIGVFAWDRNESYILEAETRRPSKEDIYVHQNTERQ